jgi:hypothetical protein
MIDGNDEFLNVCFDSFVENIGGSYYLALEETTKDSKSGQKQPVSRVREAGRLVRFIGRRVR